MTAEDCSRRFNQFMSGQWTQLLIASRECSDQACGSQHRRRRTQVDTIERIAQRAEAFVQLGELSAGRPLWSARVSAWCCTILEHVPEALLVGTSRKKFCKLFAWAESQPCRNPQEVSEASWQVGCDFGQTDFGHPYFPTLAKSDFGQLS